MSEQHVPLRSWAPVILAVGIFFVNLGFVFGVPVGVLGLVIFGAGVVKWVREDLHMWAKGGDEDGGH